MNDGTPTPKPTYPPFVAAAVACLPEGWEVTPPADATSTEYVALPPEAQRGKHYVSIVDAPLPSVSCCTQYIRQNRYISEGWIHRDRPTETMLRYYVEMMCTEAVRLNAEHAYGAKKARTTPWVLDSLRGYVKKPGALPILSAALMPPAEKEQERWSRALAFAQAADLLRVAVVHVSALAGSECPAEARELFADAPDLVALLTRRWWRAAREVDRLHPHGIESGIRAFLTANDPTVTHLHLPEEE